MDDPVLEYINSIDNAIRRSDSLKLLPLMQKASGYRPWLSGTMVGFGRYHYKYESGREGSIFVTGFAPRKQNLAIYIMPGFSQYDDLMQQLGKHKVGKSCLYINKLGDVDQEILATLVGKSVKEMRKKYTCEEVSSD